MVAAVPGSMKYGSLLAGGDGRATFGSSVSCDCGAGAGAAAAAACVDDASGAVTVAQPLNITAASKTHESRPVRDLMVELPICRSTGLPLRYANRSLGY
jgi:hypothetical protein